MQNHRTLADPQARLLSQELSAAAFALAEALGDRARRDQGVDLAREALEAFELLERGPTDFNVPREIRDMVRASLELLREGRLELAHASLRRAGRAFERHVLGTAGRRWRH